MELSSLYLSSGHAKSQTAESEGGGANGPSYKVLPFPSPKCSALLEQFWFRGSLVWFCGIPKTFLGGRGNCEG